MRWSKCISLVFLSCSVVAVHAQSPGPSLSLVTHNSVLIQATPKEVWPFVLDPSAWKAGAQLVSIGGEPGKAGERFKAVMPDDPETTLFVVENVEMASPRRRTMRLNAPTGELMGFATFELSGGDNTTVVEYHVYSQSPLPPGTDTSPEALKAMQAGYHKSNFDRFAAELEALKQLVEANR